MTLLLTAIGVSLMEVIGFSIRIGFILRSGLIYFNDEDGLLILITSIGKVILKEGIY
jgi:hypothetical protein